MEDNNYEEYNEDKGITLFQIFNVLFGRKILFLSIWIGVAFITFLVIYFGISPKSEYYYSGFNYAVAGLSDGKYMDGSRFDLRDLISLESLEEYKKEYTALSDVDMEKIYYGDVLQFSYENATRKTSDDGTLGDYTNTTLEGLTITKSGFYLRIKKKALSKEKAKALAEAIANEPNLISIELANKKDYTNNLKLYDASTIYDDQITYLQSQLTLVYDGYQNLIDSYGDVYLNDSQKVSDVVNVIKQYFQNYSLTDLANELKYGGYVKNYDTYLMYLNNQKTELTRLMSVDNNKKSDLEAQLETLLKNGGSMQTLQIEEYNSEIIRLTEEIRDTEESLALLQIKIDNKEKAATDVEYQADVAEFESKLETFRDKMESITTEYSANEKQVVNTYSTVYMINNSLGTVGGMSTKLTIIIPLVLGLVLGLLVNLVLDGKKLSPNYVEPKKKEELDSLNNDNKIKK